MKGQNIMKILSQDLESARDSFSNISRELAKILVVDKKIISENGRLEIL